MEVSMEDVDQHRAAIIRSYCSIDTIASDLSIDILSALTTAASQFPDWKLGVRQASDRTGGQIAVCLEKDGQMKLVGYWTKDGQPAQPEYTLMAESAVQNAWKSLHDTAPENIGERIFLRYLVPPLVMWILLLVFVPPIMDGFKEFRDTPAYKGYWWWFVTFVYALSSYMWYLLLSRLMLYWKLGTHDDLNLVEDFRERSKGPGFFRRWWAWVRSGVPWPLRSKK